MKLKPVLLVLAGALIALALLLLLAIATPQGLRWTLALLGTRVPIQLENPSGTLLQGVSADRALYSDAELRLELGAVSLTPEWSCLWRALLCVEEASARELSITAGASSEDSGSDPLEVFSELPAIEVRQLTIDRLNLSIDGTAEQIRGLHLSGRLDPQGLRLEYFSLCHDLACGDGRLSLSARGRWELLGAMSPQAALLDVAELQLPEKLGLEASGDLDGLTLAVADRADGTQLLDGRLSRDGGGLRATIEIDGLAELVPALNKPDWFAMQGPLALSFAGDLDSWSMEFEQQVAIDPAQPLPLRGELRRRGESWHIDQLVLGDSDDPALTAEASWPDTQAPVTIEAGFKRFPLPAATGIAGGTLDGRAHIQFLFDDAVRDWAFDTSGLTLQEEGRTWRVAGELSAPNFDDLPAGELQLVFRPPEPRNDQEIALRYTRDRASKQAVLATTGPVILGDVSLSSVDLRRLPSPENRFRLRSEGDLATLVDFSLKREEESARLDAEPFSILYAGESVVIEDRLQLAWDAGSETLRAAPLCLRWQGSRLCSEATDLASSGTLKLSIEVSEQYADAIAGKPFAVSANGEGELDLAWEEWAPEQARVVLDLNPLRIDPFVAASTAAPVEFQRVTVEGAATATDTTLRVRIESEQVGNIDVDMQMKDGDLGAVVQSERLSLAAFSDLLPRWDIGTGDLSVDMKVAGRVEDPRFNGTVKLIDASVTVPDLDTRLDSIGFQADFRGRTAKLDGRAELGGGELRLSGRCCDSGRLQATLSGDRNRLTLPNGLDAVFTPNLVLALDPRGLGVRGAMTVHSGVFEHSGLGEGGVELSEDVVRVDDSSTEAQRFTLDLDLRALIEPGFTLRSRQLESTLGGDLRLRMQSGSPISLFGNLDVLGGELRVYGQALRLTTGALGFVGDPMDPDLDISAEREIRSDNQRVGFRVSGTLEDPRFDLFSEPQRPEYVTLSYLLRGRGPDVGASADGTAMALSLGASALNRSGVLAPLNSLPGLSGVTLGAEGSDEDMAATISAYVGNRLYLSYGVGIYEPINALTARLYLRSRLWLEVVSRLESSFDLYYRFDTD